MFIVFCFVFSVTADAELKLAVPYDSFDSALIAASGVTIILGWFFSTF